MPGGMYLRVEIGECSAKCAVQISGAVAISGESWLGRVVENFFPARFRREAITGHRAIGKPPCG